MSRSSADRVAGSGYVYTAKPSPCCCCVIPETSTLPLRPETVTNNATPQGSNLVTSITDGSGVSKRSSGPSLPPVACIRIRTGYSRSPLRITRSFRPSPFTSAIANWRRFSAALAYSIGRPIVPSGSCRSRNTPSPARHARSARRSPFRSPPQSVPCPDAAPTISTRRSDCHCGSRGPDSLLVDSPVSAAATGTRCNTIRKASLAEKAMSSQPSAFRSARTSPAIFTSSG